MTVAPRTLRDLLAAIAPDLVDGRRLSWHDKAACVGSDVDYFSDKAGEVAAAQRICSRCPVAAQCAAYGRDEREGVWGGTSPASRALGRRRAG